MEYYFGFMRFRTKIIFIFMGLILSCSENNDSIESSEILDTQFTFHQDVGMLYFSMTVDTDYLSSSNVEATVLWYGTNISNSPDSLILNDDGIDGDIIINDRMYSLKVKNDSTSSIKNAIGNDSGKVFADYILTSSDKIVTQSDSFEIGNLMPKILSIVFPDSMLHPSQPNYYAIDSIFINVFDPNGLNDIRSCYLFFQKPDGSYANNGEPIFLYDDGNKSDENISLWDGIANDGTFSRLITIGNENPIGKYYATFFLNDWGGLFTSETDSLIVYE